MCGESDWMKVCDYAIVVGLLEDADSLMDQALATSTKNIYAKHVSLFKTFCHQLGIDILDGFKAKAVEMWLARMHKEGVAYSTIRARLSALRNYSIRKNFRSELNTPQIQLMLKGIKKSGRAKKVKTVVTLSHLRRLIRASRRALSEKRHSRFAAMITVAFFGFLRPSEFCSSRGTHGLQWNDVKFSRNQKSIRLTLSSFKHSKRPGRVVVWGLDREYCPLKFMQLYLKHYENCHDLPLFNVTQGEFRRQLKKMCRVAGIKSSLTPHCFRHGGATWAGRQGWPDARIRAHGRWASEAYKQYVRPF